MSNEPVTLRRVPVRMFLPPSCERVTPVIMREREWEPSSTQWILSSIRRGDVFVDIGAHAGYYTLIAAGVVGAAGHVFAFEPDPSNFSFLRRNVELNGFRNVTLEQRAVAERNSSRTLYLNPKNTGDHRLAPHGGMVEAPSGVDVDVVALDDYFRVRGSRVDFVKMDTQGAELLILQGMREILRANERIRLLVEFWPHGLVQLGGTGERLLGELAVDGFNLSRSDRAKLLATYTAQNKKHVNLMLYRPGFEVPA